MKNHTSLIVAVLLSAWFIPQANAADTKDTKLKVAGSKDLQKPPALNAAVVAYGKNGVRRCLKRVGQVTDFLSSGSKTGMFLFSPNEEPDNRMLSTSMEIASANVLSYASSSFHPRGDSDCAGVYEAITYWQDNCDTVATQAYGKLRQSGVIQTHIRVLDGGPAMRVFLMPAGPGCVAIKKEVLY